MAAVMLGLMGKTAEPGVSCEQGQQRWHSACDGSRGGHRLVMQIDGDSALWGDTVRGVRRRRIQCQTETCLRSQPAPVRVKR
jgi:hypothetical protein